MGQVTVRERIYVDVNGRRVEEGSPRAASLAAVPGDLMSEERASMLGVKEKTLVEDKAAAKSETKGFLGAESRRGK